MRPIQFVRLHNRNWLLPQAWPVATILGQSLASLCIALEAVWRVPPHFAVDTMGYAFALPVFRLVGPVACYLHYPTVSWEMIGNTTGLKYVYYFRNTDIETETEKQDEDFAIDRESYTQKGEKERQRKLKECVGI